MIWLFLSVVLLLLVLHPGFRKVAGWITGACALLAIIVVGVIWSQTHQSAADTALSGTPVPPNDLPTSVPTCPAGVESKPGVCFAPASTTPVDTSQIKWDPPAGFKLDCAPGQFPARAVSGKESCYNPHDAEQLAEHIKECKLEPGDPYAGTGKVVADRRGVPCNEFDKFDNDCPAPPATPWPGCVSRDSKPWEKYDASKAPKGSAK